MFIQKKMMFMLKKHIRKNVWMYFFSYTPCVGL